VRFASCNIVTKIKLLKERALVMVPTECLKSGYLRTRQYIGTAQPGQKLLAAAERRTSPAFHELRSLLALSLGGDFTEKENHVSGGPKRFKIAAVHADFANLETSASH